MCMWFHFYLIYIQIFPKSIININDNSKVVTFFKMKRNKALTSSKRLIIKRGKGSKEGSLYTNL